MDVEDDGDTGDGVEGDAGDGGTGDETTDWKAEAEKAQAELETWKANSRKHEDRSKKTAKELADLKKAGLPDTEKAITDAEERGRTAARAEAAQRLVGAEIKAALAGVVPDPAGIVEDLNLAKYLTEDGEVDDAKVAALKAKYEALAVKPKRGSADGGSQGGDGGKPKQLSRADLKSMSPEKVVEAQAKGQLDDLLAGKTS